MKADQADQPQSRGLAGEKNQITDTVQHRIPAQAQRIPKKEELDQDQEYQKDLQGDLLAAISKLSDSRRQVIELIYFDEFSPVEIAARMKKSVGAIYSLQFNALNDLRKILGNNRNNINE